MANLFFYDNPHFYEALLFLSVSFHKPTLFLTKRRESVIGITLQGSQSMQSLASKLRFRQET